ncbi:hypothetical protein [Dyella sp. 2RAB6]|uniref:hypothetical protein n=1 Tax=Dyella sp. 2RAB6 TaxID=3232992 RepID=UPI003F935EDA
MSTFARHVIKGPAAYLIIRQARKVSESSGRAIYQLGNDATDLGVYDSRAETLVVLDAPGLVALAMTEVTSDRPAEQSGGIDMLA